MCISVMSNAVVLMNILWNIPLFKDVKVPYGNYMSCILGDSHAKMYLAVKYFYKEIQFNRYQEKFNNIFRFTTRNIKSLSNQYYSIFLIESQMALILSRLSILSEKSFITERNDDKRYGKLFTSLVDFHYLSCQVI